MDRGFSLFIGLVDEELYLWIPPSRCDLKAWRVNGSIVLNRSGIGFVPG
jgi:hypothetical protein